MTTLIPLSSGLDKRLSIDSTSIVKAKGQRFYNRLVRTLNRPALSQQILQLPADISNISIYYQKPQPRWVDTPSWDKPIEGLVAFINLNKGQGPYEVLDGALVPLPISGWSLLPFKSRVKRALSPVLETARQKVPVFRHRVNQEVNELSRMIHGLKASMFFVMEAMDTCRDQGERFQEKMEQERPGYEQLSRLLEQQQAALQASDRQIQKLEDEKRQKVSVAQARRQQAEAQDLIRQYHQAIEAARQKRRICVEQVKNTQREINEHPYSRLQRHLDVSIPVELNSLSRKLAGHKIEIAAYEQYRLTLQA